MVTRRRRPGITWISASSSTTNTWDYDGDSENVVNLEFNFSASFDLAFNTSAEATQDSSDSNNYSFENALSNSLLSFSFDGGLVLPDIDGDEELNGIVPSNQIDIFFDIGELLFESDSVQEDDFDSDNITDYKYQLTGDVLERAGSTFNLNTFGSERSVEVGNINIVEDVTIEIVASENPNSGTIETLADLLDTNVSSINLSFTYSNEFAEIVANILGDSLSEAEKQGLSELEGASFTIFPTDDLVTGNDDVYESFFDSDTGTSVENDTRETAYDLSLNEGAWLRTINGSGYQADDDWYKIQVAPGDNRLVVDLQFSHAEGDIDLQVYDASGTVVASSTGVTDNELIEVSSPLVGDYYLRVYGSGGNTNNIYDLRWSASNVIGEFGTLTLGDTSQTITLNHSFTNPVVFAGPLSYNGRDPATVRLSEITSNSFTAFIQEPNSSNGTHTLEEFSYLVLEAGTWQLADGTLLEVGKLDTSELASEVFVDPFPFGRNINFANDFAQTPVTFSQVQTNNDSDFVRTRHRNTNTDGFELALEEEEALPNSDLEHDLETVGWFAIEPGQGQWSGNTYQIGRTEDSVTHAWDDLEFAPLFTQAPNFLANIATYDGYNPAGLRYQNLTSNGLEIKVEEDQSADLEISHPTEIVNFFAISGSGLLDASSYTPETDVSSLAVGDFF